MYRILYIINLFIFASITTQGQNLTASQAKLAQLECWQPTSNTVLPEQVSLKKYTPKVGNQGNSNACVGWAIGYGAMTIQQAKNLNISNQDSITELAYSAAFIYRMIEKEEKNDRVGLVEGITVVQQKGNVPYKDFHSANITYNKSRNAHLIVTAKKAVIPQTTLLFKKETNTQKKINNTKAALAKGFPVVLSMSTRKNFYQLKNARYWWPELGNTSPMGGHALVVIAYDNKKQAFQVMNSWGETWGKNGFVWIKYADFARFAKHAFCLTDLTEPI